MSDLSFKNFKNEALKNPAVRKEYDDLAPIFELRRKLIKLRMDKGITQEQLAEIMGTNKSNISRLESGENISYPTFKTVSKYAAALGYKVDIEFRPI